MGSVFVSGDENLLIFVPLKEIPYIKWKNYFIGINKYNWGYKTQEIKKPHEEDIKSQVINVYNQISKYKNKDNLIIYLFNI